MSEHRTADNWRAWIREATGASKDDLRALCDDLAACEMTLFAAQQALLTEGQARNAAEERAEKAERENYRAVWLEAAGQRDALAAKLEECKRDLREERGNLSLAEDAVTSARLDAGRLREALGYARPFVRFDDGGEERFNQDVARRVDAALATPGDGLWEALRPYLRHKKDCHGEQLTDGTVRNCTCGLDALLRGGGET